MKLQRKHMLLRNFNQKLEAELRAKYNVHDSTIPVLIDWSEDGSCICSVVVGDVEKMFSYFDYEAVKTLLREFFDASDVQLLEDHYWPYNSIDKAFKEYTAACGITDPKVNCGANLPEEFRSGWNEVYEQNAIVEITPVVEDK